MLYLASQSPQRSKLLNDAHIAFELIHSNCDEETIIHDHPQATAIERALGKAREADLAGCTFTNNTVILSADTVVILNGELIGKPRDPDHAKEILGKLQGSTHSVATAHCCLRPSFDDQPASEAIGLAISKVTMKAMSADDINAYVASGESDNRAGAYAIQETGDRFVVDVEGDFDTIVGLNIKTVQRLYLQCCDQELESIP